MRKLCLLFVLVSACTDERNIGAVGDDPDQGVFTDQTENTVDSKALDSAVPSDSPDVTPDIAVPDAGDCWSAWAAPAAVVTETQRPTNKGMQARFYYELDAQGFARIELQKLVGRNIVLPSDGPFSPSTHSGSWAELRDSSDNTLHTTLKHELVHESVEVHPPPNSDMGFENVPACPKNGFFDLSGLPNDPTGTQIVLFSEPVDGVMTNKTVELARFQLP